MGAVSRMVMGLATRQVVRGAAAGPAAIVIGMALPYAARTLGPAGMVVLALGGWLMKRMLKRRLPEAR